ncbi:hypothetical protein HK405_002510 [Cladochytrium tenue]|nr:hypothetical protein HK405_002510 [Cladochytrium tenue]
MAPATADPAMPTASQASSSKTVFSSSSSSNSIAAHGRPDNALQPHQLLGSTLPPMPPLPATSAPAGSTPADPSRTPNPPLRRTLTRSASRRDNDNDPLAAQPPPPLRPMLTTSDTIRRRHRAATDVSAGTNGDATTAAVAAADAAHRSRTRRNRFCACPDTWTPPNSWVAFSWLATCCCPGFCLRLVVKGSDGRAGGSRETLDGPRQAWREKVALCWIVATVSAVVACFVVLLNGVVCPPSRLANDYVPLNAYGGVLVRGTMFNALDAVSPYQTLFDDAARTFPGIDVTTQFSQPSWLYDGCTGINASWASLLYPCERDGSCLDVNELLYPSQGVMGMYPYNRTAGSSDGGRMFKPFVRYSWAQVRARGLVVLFDSVLDLRPYLRDHPNLEDPSDPVELLARSAAAIGGGADATLLAARDPALRDFPPALRCLAQKYYAGRLAAAPAECVLTASATYLAAAVVLGIVGTRFAMAVAFAWCVAGRLSRRPRPRRGGRNRYYTGAAPAQLQSLPPPPLPLLGQLAALDAALALTQAAAAAGASKAYKNRRDSVVPVAAPLPPPPDSVSDQHAVLLVTVYSEPAAAVRGTLESLVATEYDDSRKLLVVVCDGLVVSRDEGDNGNNGLVGAPGTTADAVLALIRLDPELGARPRAYAYVAVGEDDRQYNMARVYCGTYEYKGRSVPTIVVVKCGGPDEEATSGKPGNRGKRDSQLVLMNFFSRVVLRDRMTPLDYDLFRKIHHITGFTPDYYELILMVDADTTVEAAALRAMSNCMVNDPRVMGLCGETMVANKSESWVTAIQVFEYYVSHHLGKAFESVFGGVTCLPGCFSMYRIKARSAGGGGWVPILANPDIVAEYATGSVATLHQKNLLLLGEDRFLSTLLLRTFPRRRTVFVPAAVCRTTAPSDLKTLLSQRRRWINSTVHNLMELLLVRHLCGTFCFSMQFVVLTDLIGTAAMPASLCLLAYTIYAAASAPPAIGNDDPSAAVPFFLGAAMLAAVLFLPAVLATLVSRRAALLPWMLAYLVALPIWQLLLPLYAFWNFDDFSWGATQQQQQHQQQQQQQKDELQVKAMGAAAGKGPEHTTNVSESAVPFRRWEEYEAAWRRAVLAKRVAVGLPVPTSSAALLPTGRPAAAAAAEEADIARPASLMSFCPSDKGSASVAAAAPAHSWLLSSSSSSSSSSAVSASVRSSSMSESQSSASASASATASATATAATASPRVGSAAPARPVLRRPFSGTAITLDFEGLDEDDDDDDDDAAAAAAADGDGEEAAFVGEVRGGGRGGAQVDVRQAATAWTERDIGASRW